MALHPRLSPPLGAPSFRPSRASRSWVPTHPCGTTTGGLRSAPGDAAAAPAGQAKKAVVPGTRWLGTQPRPCCLPPFRLLLSPRKGELWLCHLLRGLDPFPQLVVAGSVCRGERPRRPGVLQFAGNCEFTLWFQTRLRYTLQARFCNAAAPESWKVSWSALLPQEHLRMLSCLGCVFTPRCRAVRCGESPLCVRVNPSNKPGSPRWFRSPLWGGKGSSPHRSTPVWWALVALQNQLRSHRKAASAWCSLRPRDAPSSHPPSVGSVCVRVACVVGVWLWLCSR